MKKALTILLLTISLLVPQVFSNNVSLNEISQNVELSNKSFKSLTRIQLGTTIQILDYRYWNTVPGGLKKIYQLEISSMEFT